MPERRAAGAVEGWLRPVIRSLSEARAQPKGLLRASRLGGDASRVQNDASRLPVIALLLAAAASARAAPAVIVAPAQASPMEVLAAREIRRYTYLRTGSLLPLVSSRPAGAEAIVVARKSRPVVATAPKAVRTAAASLRSQEYLLRTAGPTVYVVGGDDAGTLYGAYRLAEKLGVRFYLHGDVIPEPRVPFRLPALNERRSPLFALRGIQPFHDFPEGPDWWNADDYKAVIGQLPKMGMNFVGLHVYPEGKPSAEPGVWIGRPEDIRPDGAVGSAYPSAWQNTILGTWGYAPKPTSRFLFGAATLFDRDDFGAEVMRGLTPRPASPEGQNLLFRRAGRMLGDVFSYAKGLGVQTCIGTEVPLTVPEAVRAKLRALDADTESSPAIRRVYEGIFSRLTAVGPPDWYWLWTPEPWTWQAVPAADIDAAVRDMRLAQEAWAAVRPPFRLAACGWVLGPPQDPTLLDRALPKSWALSCINRQVGNSPVDPAFAGVRGRGKWAIPWLEDDPGLTIPQLWAGRMRRDAADALGYGCDGLMGIHWRTRVLGPNIAALAAAAWRQEPGWASGIPEEHTDGETASYPDSAIARTENDPVYRDVRYNLTGYSLRVPNGSYKVTLQFCEVHYDRHGARVFDVSLQGERVIEGLDVFERVGRNAALDFEFHDVKVTDGVLKVGFTPIVEYPAVAGIVIERPGYTRRVNCGGPAWGGWEADIGGIAAERYAPVDDFYRDWALANFGREAARDIAAVFARVDGRLPRPAGWTDGPGGISPDPRPWSGVAPAYGFVSELEELRPRVRGAANLARYDEWLTTFRYLRDVAHLCCEWAEMDRRVAAANGTDPKEGRYSEALEARVKVVSRLSAVYEGLLASAMTQGDLGTIANWEQRAVDRILGPSEAALGVGYPNGLPQHGAPPTWYSGPPRVFVPTVRTAVAPNEDLRLTVLALAEGDVRDAALWWRRMGQGAWHRVPLRHRARGVYDVAVDVPADGLEYRVGFTDGHGRRASWPQGGAVQTVILAPMKG